jgi:ADP-ribose pyrophosphatase YjhB (NUDIX family)/catechol 2,3-dioxygenase-like lactoylglutathione lyase family enzyme
MADPSLQPRVGVGVFVLRDGLVLLGQRLGSHGAGTWALPGGHLEFGETVERCAMREVHEETGLTVDVVARGPYTNDVLDDVGKHYVTVFVLAHAPHGEPELREPAKCAEWRWCRWNDLPTPLFAPLANLHASGYVPDGADVRPRQALGLVSLVVRDYDEAIAFYVGTLGFTLIEDTFVPEQNKRWVVVAPPGSRGCRLLLARAANDEQGARVGRQTGGRVFLFLYTDDFARDHAAYRAKGVQFVREPKREPYGTVAVFRDLYGNLWDLLQPSDRAVHGQETRP